MDFGNEPKVNVSGVLNRDCLTRILDEPEFYDVGLRSVDGMRSALKPATVRPLSRRRNVGRFALKPDFQRQAIGTRLCIAPATGETRKVRGTTPRERHLHLSDLGRYAMATLQPMNAR
jgi:hypothetical protein